MSARILVVDDEAAIRETIGYALRSEGFDVEERETGEEALAAIGANAWDVVVLDVMLPGVSGIEVCRRVRAESDVPILMLTARDAEVDRVVGLEAGADDYVGKPFSMAELVSRVRAILRRRELDRSATVRRVGDVELDMRRHTVRVAGEPVRVTSTEFRLLTLLASEDRPFSRREIMRHLWESSHVGDERAADAHIANIRPKIEEDPAAPRRLVTVRGVGYHLLAM